ncbi:MAG: SDH family Clp fold serine proteinase [Actinomycetota bacterium]
MDEQADTERDSTSSEQEEEPKEPVRTPLYRALNSERYSRQSRIRDIQESAKSKLICYVSGPLASLTRDDVLPLVDLLHVIPVGSNIDLLLHTPGGEIDAAEKMANMIRRHVGDGGIFRVIVPDFAKSAGTLISLAADTIVMSDSSELGPIDPQLRLPDGSGAFALRPAQSYIDGYEALVELVNSNPGAPAYETMLKKYDPTLLDICRKVITRSTKLAEELLQRGMFRGGGNYTATASELSNNRKWLQHSVPIDYIEAKKLGLDVTYLEPTDELWQEYWALYCEQRLARNPDDCKLFESDYVSIPLS